MGRYISYTEKSGRIFYNCTEHFPMKVIRNNGSYKILSSDGEVPQEVVLKGIEAVRTYVDIITKADIDRQWELARLRKKFLARYVYQVEHVHKGVVLKGTVRAPYDEDIIVRLEIPFIGEDTLYYHPRGSKKAMEGDILRKEVVERARIKLMELYEKALYFEKNPAAGLVEKLNKQENRKLRES